jgi:hypothetical protein
MLSDTKTGSTRFTKVELAEIRERAARNGYRIEQVKNHREAMDALMKALPSVIREDMLEFMMTGRSRLTSGVTLEEFERHLHDESAEN